MLEKKIETLGQYFDGMFRIDNDNIGVRTIFPQNWKSYSKKADKYTITAYPFIEDNTNKILFVSQSSTTSFENIIDFIQEVIITNTENEKKIELFNEKYKELAKVFDENRLSKLETLVFKFGKKKSVIEKQSKNVEINTPLEYIVNDIIDEELDETKILIDE